MNSNINIDLFRVSGDSNYLDMIFNCPRGYYFTSLELEVRYINEDKKFVSSFYDLSSALFDNTDTETSTKGKRHWTVRLPLSKLGIAFPAIYKGTFKVSTDDQELPAIEPDHAICSDVNYAYRCMLDDILTSENSCTEFISDEAIRKYLLLYGHTAAMAAEDVETMEEFFRLIGNCFGKCPSHSRKGSSCCSGREVSPKSNSCNCGR